MSKLHTCLSHRSSIRIRPTFGFNLATIVFRICLGSMGFCPDQKTKSRNKIEKYLLYVQDERYKRFKNVFLLSKEKRKLDSSLRKGKIIKLVNYGQRILESTLFVTCLFTRS